MGVNLIVAGHYETEKPVMNKLQKLLSDKFSEAEIFLLDETNPVEFAGK